MIIMLAEKQEIHDAISPEQEKNVNLGIVVPAEKLNSWSTTTSGL